jgi:stage II sporulation protein D
LAITAVERRALGAALLLVLAACIRSEVQLPATPPSAPGGAGGAAPSLRIGLLVGAPTVDVGGSAGITITGPDRSVVARLAPGLVGKATPRPGKVLVAAAGPGGRGEAATLILRPEPGGFVRVNGRDYRGEIVLFRDRTGVTAINRVGIEEYLAGVVSAESGIKDPGDVEALRAQTIVARTYALRNVGRRESDGFDLWGSVEDQVYGGVGAETGLGRDAVAVTRGQVVTYQGELIDAFYSSTCGGRTSIGTEIFKGANRPYLRSIDDAPKGGPAYCSISPRFTWREEQSGEVLRATLKKTLPVVAQVPGAEAEGLRNVSIVGRTPSGRVSALDLALKQRTVQINGPQVRYVLRLPDGRLLWSTLFTMNVRARGGKVTGIVLDGHGSGHGVGLCQWGAIGRARAGQKASDIITAYYAGTTIVRRY